MNRLVLAAVFVTVFAASLAAAMPLGAALAWTQSERAGLSARAVSGSIWNGHLEDMRLNGVRFGNVEARLDPFAILTGASRVHLQSREGRAVLVRSAAQGLEDADATLDISTLGLELPLQGVVRLQGAVVLFENGRCSKAQGHLIADIVHGDWKAPPLAGELSCAGQFAVAKLSGRNADAELNLTFSIDANAVYRLQSRVANMNAALRLALSVAGFTEDERGLQRTDQGRLGT